MPGVPVAILTNATCLDDPEAAQDMALADVVLPSLDALDPDALRAVNRPHPDVDPDRLARSILEFGRTFPGKLYLEVLLVSGMNDGPQHLERMHAYCAELDPDRVDVVTLTRPGAVPDAKAADPATLAAWRQALGKADKAVRPSDSGAFRTVPALELEQAVLASLARRPQTVVDLAAALEASEQDLTRLVDELARKGRLKTIEAQGRTFYFAPERES